jgi:anaerobic magnesium-protoporphyrin IX monomethyl ester cyclase
MARLLVTHNWHQSLDPHSWVESKPYPPLGSLVVAQALRDLGHEVAFHDTTWESGPERFPAVLDRFRPDRVLLVPDHHAVPQKMCLDAQRRAAFAMIAAARERGARVCVSGPDATDRPDEYLAAGAEIVIRGEPDPGLLAWVRDDAVIPGSGERAPAMTDLSWLPSPAWDLIDLAPYQRAWARHGGWEAPVSAARGCPYRCNWCAKPNWGRKITLRPAAAVVADARKLAELGAARIWFMDDIFAIRRDWLSDFRSEVARQGGIPPYRCLSRADLLVRDDRVADLAASGCAEVWMGAESGSQKVLDAMDKDQDVAEIHEAARRLKAAGIRVGFFLQLGYPGEKLADVHATLAMVRAAQPDEIGISVTLPLPGTVFFEKVKDQLEAESWQTAMDNEILFDAEYPQPFYDAARQALRHEHAFSQGLLAARRLLQGRPAGLRKDVRRVAATVVHAPRIPLHHLQMRWYALRSEAP